MKKKVRTGIISGIAAVIAVGGIFSIFHFTSDNQYTEGICNENLSWSLEDGTLTISGEGEMNDLSNAGEQPWSTYRDEIKKVVIEEGVTNVGSYSFAENKKITKLTLPESVVSIGEYAFMGGDSLTELSVPDNITYIGESAFDSTGVKSLTLPDNGIEIDDYAFTNCTRLESVVIPESVKLTGGFIFDYSPWLERLKAEESLVIINGCVINGEECSGEVVIPDGVVSIGAGAFTDNMDITSITMPDSVAHIGAGAFFGCTSLEEITISENVTSIGSMAFYFTAWIEEKMQETPLISVNGILVDGRKAEGDIVLSDDITSIAESAFFGNENITSVYIPEGTEYIGKMAFGVCDALIEITIANRECDIPDIITENEAVVICGYKGSSADKYAEEYGFEFKAIE